MSESSNSGVLSRALLLPLRRISLISSSRDVGSFAMIPAREQCRQVVCREEGVGNTQGRPQPAAGGRGGVGSGGARGPVLPLA